MVDFIANASTYLDREVATGYQITVVATDQGTPALNNTAQVSLILIDLNDNAPLFSRPQYGCTVFEGDVVDDLCTIAAASDADVARTDFSAISYSLDTAAAGFLEINGSGFVTISTELACRHNQNYTGRVTARDGGDPALFTAVNVSVDRCD